jgi:hypothetical protein
VLGQGYSGSVTPLEDGDSVTLECGPQGGQHLTLALGMRDLDQWRTTTTFTATQPGGVTIPPTAYRFAYAVTDGGACELVDLRFQVIAFGESPLLGKPLDLTVVARDASGLEATATRHVNVAPEATGPCFPQPRPPPPPDTDAGP